MNTVSTQAGQSVAETLQQPIRCFGEAGQKVSPLWPYLLICAVVAACIDLGHLHLGDNADSIVPILTSLQRWTPYFWEEDRFGMLLPLLAWPFSHPFVNLLVQEWLGTFSGLAAFFLLARYVLRDALWPIPATLASAYLIALVPAQVRFDWFVTQQYGVSLSVTLAALLLLEGIGDAHKRGLRVAGALILVVMAHWVNFSVSAVFIPLLIARFLLGSPLRRLLRQLLALRVPDRVSLRKLLFDSDLLSIGLLLLGTVSGRSMLRFVKYTYSTNVGTVPSSEWLTAWRSLSTTTQIAVFPQPLYLFLLVGPAIAGTILLFAVPRLRRFTGNTLGTAGLLVGAAMIYYLAVATVVHVKTNLYDRRYAYPSLLLISLAVATLAVVPLRAVAAKHLRYALPMSMALLLFAAVYSYGVPSVATARQDLDVMFGGTTQEILSARVNVITGTYWKVWPAVFHANQALYERGEHRRVFGLTVRSQPTRKMRSAIPLGQVRAAILAGDGKDGASWLDDFGPPMSMVEHLSTIDVFAYQGPPCTSRLQGLPIEIRTPEAAEARRNFGFQLTLHSDTHCWYGEGYGETELTGEWTDNASGKKQPFKTKLNFPMYLAPGSVENVLALTPAPRRPGSYSFRVLEINHERTPLPTQTVDLRRPARSNSINSPKGLAAEYKVEDLPTVFRAGAKGKIRIVARNTGTAVWLAISPPAKGSVGLGIRWQNARGEEVLAGRLYIPYSIYPNTTCLFAGRIDVPKEPGDYTLSLDMVSELVTWFHDSGVRPIEARVRVAP